MANKILSTIKLLFEFQYQRKESQTSSCLLSKIHLHLVFEKKNLIWSMSQSRVSCEEKNKIKKPKNKDN